MTGKRDGFRKPGLWPASLPGKVKLKSISSKSLLLAISVHSKYFDSGKKVDRMSKTVAGIIECRSVLCKRRVTRFKDGQMDSGLTD